jgi:hypothetical protein
MGLKGYRLWVVGQLESTCKSPTTIDSFCPTSWFNSVDFP